MRGIPIDKPPRYFMPFALGYPHTETGPHMGDRFVGRNKEHAAWCFRLEIPPVVRSCNSKSHCEFSGPGE